jgi:hypothetical protein
MAEHGSIEWMKATRELGVRRVAYHPNGALAEIEFLAPTQAPPLVEPGRFDADTLIPPEPQGEQPVVEARAAKVPPALSRLLKNGSIS